MASVTRFGSFPGVRIDAYGTPVTGLQIGEEDNLVVFGEGNVASGDASEGEAFNASSVREIENGFGSNTELNEALRLARQNNANPEFTYGVVVRSNWSEDESFTGVSSGTLSNAPLYGLDTNGDDVDEYVRFYDLNEEVELNVNLVDDSGTTVSSPSTDNTVNVGVVSGDWEADSSSDYEVTYQYFDNDSEGTASDGTLSNVPVIEDKDRLRVFDTTGGFLEGTELNVVFRYDESFNAPSDADTVYVNPITGEWNADAVSDDTYQFYYVPKDFDTTFDDVDNVVQENETGIYHPITASLSVASTLSTKINDLRGKYKMVQAVSIAQPNDTDLENEEPVYDVSTYSDSIDNDAYYLVAPSRDADNPREVATAVASQMAGTPLEEPIYNNVISDVEGLVQVLDRDERATLRDNHVIPIKETSDLRIEGNISTSTETDYQRTFFVRRIVDTVVLVSKILGDNIIGQKNTEDSRRDLRSELRGRLEDLSADNVIKGNTDTETNWYVNVSESGFNEVSVEVGVTPFGVIKSIDEEIIIDTST